MNVDNMTDDEVLQHLDPTDPLQRRVESILLATPALEILETEWINPNECREIDKVVTAIDVVVEEMRQLTLSDEPVPVEDIEKLADRLDEALGNMPETDK